VGPASRCARNVSCLATSFRWLRDTGAVSDPRRNGPYRSLGPDGRKLRAGARLRDKRQRSRLPCCRLQKVLRALHRIGMSVCNCPIGGSTRWQEGSQWDYARFL